MIRGQIEFMRGLLRQPSGVVVWVGWLVGVNGIGSLLFLDRLEARVVLGVFAVSGLLMGMITARTGFSRLLGLGHVLWVPLLVWLGPRLGVYPVSEPFGLWLRLLMVSNGISLVIDTLDVVRYARGERESY